METTNLIRLAVDAYKGVPSAFSEGNPSDVIRNALIELNGGDTKISYKKIRDGKCQGLLHSLKNSSLQQFLKDFRIKPNIPVG